MKQRYLSGSPLNTGMASGGSEGKVWGIVASSTQSFIVPVSISRTALEPWACSDSDQSFTKDFTPLRLDNLGETSVNFWRNFQSSSVPAQAVCIFTTFLSLLFLPFSFCTDNILRQDGIAEAAGREEQVKVARELHVEVETCNIFSTAVCFMFHNHESNSDKILHCLDKKPWLLSS